LLKQNFAYTNCINLSLTMTRHILILVVFFSFLGVVLAQEKIITVQVIIDDEQEEHPGSVYITNSRNNFQVVTDSKGKAIIAAKSGDFLFFTSEPYYNQSLIVTEEILRKEMAEIILKSKVILLEEANLGFRLTGDLAKYAKNARYKDSVSLVYNNLGVNEVDVPPPSPYGQEAGSGMIAENLVGAITGYNKKQKLNKEFEKKQNDMKYLLSNWGNEYFVDFLKIPEHKILEFIFFVYETTDIYTKVKNNNFLEAEKILKEQSNIYLQRLNK